MMKGDKIMKEGLNVKEERSVLVPFLVGGFIGAGIALLLAPKSGRELRKDISDIASDTRDKVATTIDKGKELYAEGTAAVKNAIGAGIDAGKVAYVSEIEKLRKAV
jgi:gas vesicle protein